MKRKHIITFVTCALVILAFVIPYALIDREEEKHIKVGYIFIGDASNAYTDNFIRAKQKIEEKYGENVTSYCVYNLPEGEEVCDAIDGLVSEGCELIIGNSYSFGTYMKKSAKKYPKVEFVAVTCDNANQEPVLDNYHTGMGQVCEGRYISGVVAGMKLKELIDKGDITAEEAWIGYVAAFPYSEVISGYTAFFMGVRSIVPEVQMKVMYTNTWNGFKIEKQYAKRLIEEGCIIISQHSDTAGPATACEEMDASEIVYNVSYNGSMIDVAPTTSLIGCAIDWYPYLISVVDAVMRDKDIEAVVDAETYGNDSWAGFDKGWVTMTELNELIAAEGTKEKIDELIRDFKNGSVDIYKGDLKGVDPYNPDDTIELNSGYTENEKSSSPTFHYVLEDYIHILE